MIKTKQFYFRISCIGWTVSIAVLSLISAPPEVPGQLLGWDKFQHAAAFAVLTFLLLQSFPGRSARFSLLLLAVSVLFGGLIEVAQGFLTQNRSAELLDLLADIVGSAAGYLTCRAVLSFREKRSLAPVLLFVVVAGAVCPPFHASANDNIFTSVSSIRNASDRLADESVELVTAPFDLENGGLITTLLVAGAVAVTTQYDRDIREEIAHIKGERLDDATEAGSLAGDPFLHLGVAAAVYGTGILAESPRYRELGEMFGEAAILADATTLILKQTIGRGRPSTGSDPGRYRMFGFQSNYDSLPSLHTSSSFAMASVMSATAENRLAGFAAYAAAAFVGFSRVYQDKHWASDVLLGAAIGELCGRVVTGYHATESSRKISLTPVVSGTSALVALVGRF